LGSVVTSQGVVHYEAQGNGPPVILLHGWLGSWGYWLDTMTALSDQFRTYALDFWGFGESGKPRSRYEIRDFVSLVDQFMNRLGIPSAPMVGHSMGGTVALQLAVEHPGRVTKVVAVGSPVHGSSLSLPLRLAGRKPVAHVVWRAPALLRWGIRLFSPRLARDSRRWYDMIVHDLSRTTLEAFLSSIRSLRETDLRSRLDTVSVPVMGIYGEKDIIVDPRQGDVLLRAVPRANLAMLSHCGHFPMLDDPALFNSRLKQFLTVLS
jgi:pimeloyl-ACP methyl ester carboxylesterase